MTYLETIEYMSRLGRFGMKLGTERTRAILDRIGSPDRGLRGALIAGTNGKGSTGVCLAAILESAGHRVGFMPKPHLVSYTERIQVNRKPISEDDFVATFERLRPTLDSIAQDIGQATEFEMLTVLALAYQAPLIDLLVCEVGLGGRLDATNALDLGTAVITNVDYDHQKYLGNTIEQIANEKAAIIKPGNKVVTGCKGVALEIVESHATQADAQVWRLGREISVTSRPRGWAGFSLDVSGPGFEHRDLELRLLGDYQPANAALAVACAHAIGEVTDDAVRRGLASTDWPGRLQLIAERPRVILDGGHNPAALTSAGVSLRRLIGDERLVILFGMLSERDPAQVLPALRSMRPEGAVFTETPSAGTHAVSAEHLVEVYGGGGEAVKTLEPALARAKELAGPDGNLLVCGSLYLVGDVLALQRNARRSDVG
ncbi:MAG TPA: folylpolyglutamate synthase/dihydrofolate synthase family protein [Candidatus Dormibacteraeota bacterium]|nr:folylpolyglutamate synthase/dihydrofolate synthase family protein [Candidatus Dormibacteraeota bacterium]